MGLGSQRPAVEQPDLAYTYKIRKYAPDILLFANIGAVQLNYGYSPDDISRLVDMVDADAVILHFNALQEALQPEGDTNFQGLLRKVEQVCRDSPVPVIAKEVGWGFSEEDARQLVEAGISAIDVAGAGGTSWSQVEMYRNKTDTMARVAASFRDWGIPTAESILMVRKANPDKMIIASGGLRNGVDIAKCIALGACMGGMAGPFLKAASHSVEMVSEVIHQISREIVICMFLSRATSISELQKAKLEKITPAGD
jgi:isopentenyl-diphosphate delta-isomerase